MRDLKVPARGRASPVVGPNHAIYTIESRVYAFSALTRSWDVLEFEEGTKAVATGWNNRATVELGDRLYIFSVKTGKWTQFDAEAGGAPAVK